MNAHYHMSELSPLFGYERFMFNIQNTCLEK
jgi:hypothetical protein